MTKYRKRAKRMIPLLKDLFKWCTAGMLSFPDVLHRHYLKVEIIGGW